MKVAIVFATLVAATMAGLLPDPIFPEYVPRPEAPITHPEVHSQVLNFPSDESPMIRFHINMKGSVNQEIIRRAARSILGGNLLPEWILTPEKANPLPERLPERELPGGAMPEVVPRPEILPELLPEPEHLPEVRPELPMPSLPAPGGIQEHIFRWPDAQNQLVKLRIKVNQPESGRRPLPKILPAFGVLPKPMPEPEIATPQIEVFLDIGEMMTYH